MTEHGWPAPCICQGHGLPQKALACCDRVIEVRQVLLKRHLPDCRGLHRLEGCKFRGQNLTRYQTLSCSIMMEVQQEGWHSWQPSKRFSNKAQLLLVHVLPGKRYTSQPVATSK